MQEAACRALLPAGVPIRVISDSGGHQSGFTADRDGYQALLAAVAGGGVAAIAVYDLSRLARNARLMLDLQHELERRAVPLLVANLPGAELRWRDRSLYVRPAVPGRPAAARSRLRAHERRA